MAVVGVHEELALELEVLDDLFEGFPGHVRVHLVLLAKLLEFFVEFFLRDGPSLVNGQHHPNVQSVSVITNFFQKILYKYSKKYFIIEKNCFGFKTINFLVISVLQVVVIVYLMYLCWFLR